MRYISRAMPLWLCISVAFCIYIGRANETEDRNKSLRTHRPIALALIDAGKRLLIANRDGGDVCIMDVESRNIAVRIHVGRQLSDMTATNAGDTLYVTDQTRNELIVLKRVADSFRIAQRLKTNPTPVSVCVSGQTVSVACLWPRRILLFDRKEIDAGTPTIIDLPFAPRAQLAVAYRSKLIVADSFGGNLAVIDLRRKKLESVRRLPVHNIRGMTLDAGGKNLLLTHQTLHRTGRPNGGDIRSGSLINNHVRRISLADVVNPAAYLTRDEDRYPIGDIRAGAGDPTALTQHSDGSILVTLAGVDEFAIGRPQKALWIRLKVGRRPTALAVDDKKQTAYVANTFSDSISIIDLQKSKVAAEIPVGPDADLRADERGEMLFYDARLSLDGWFSCHSCHTDGHTNGLLNDNFTDGSFGTPKRVLSLLGVKDTPHWAWNGQVTDLKSQIRSSLRSTMQGSNPDEKTVSDLTAYLQTLKPPPSATDAREISNKSAIDRGQSVFEKQRCVSCHKPPTYTSPGTYDVGLRDEAGATHFNPPSLRGLSQRGPYFHDNRAHTLEDVFGRFRHRLQSGLSEREMRDLLHFLRSL